MPRLIIGAVYKKLGETMKVRVIIVVIVVIVLVVFLTYQHWLTLGRAAAVVGQALPQHCPRGGLCLRLGKTAGD